jgi:glycosyltransferase involved in cell wall biosynthesis
VTTVSQLSASHLVQYGVAPSAKIAVTYDGADHVKAWKSDRSTLTNESGRAYVFCLGRTQSYKNVELMLSLAPHLDRMGLDLWMAGDIDIEGIASRPNAGRNIRLLGHISDDDFAYALKGALCLIFPSRIEGFGLPAVEAMTLGCPVIASTAPCLPEICGEAALFADPDNVPQWADAVRKLRDDPDLRADLIRAGLKQARRYSWRNIAITYLKLMAETDEAEQGK